MNLGDLIKRLAAEPEGKRVRSGIGYPHSYRGYYDQLAFSNVGETSVDRMLADARSAVFATYTGWKGGEYTMTPATLINIAPEGDTGVELTEGMLADILGTAPKDAKIGAGALAQVVMRAQGEGNIGDSIQVLLSDDEADRLVEILLDVEYQR